MMILVLPLLSTVVPLLLLYSQANTLFLRTSYLSFKMFLGLLISPKHKEVDERTLQGNFARLPVEIQSLIISELRTKDLLRMLRLNSHWNEFIMADEPLWKRKFLEEWGFFKRGRYFGYADSSSR